MYKKCSGMIEPQSLITEAAAATIVELREISAIGGDTVILKVDKPFLYIIKENSTGAIIFIGMVGKPDYSWLHHFEPIELNSEFPVIILK